jgi:glutaminase
MIQADKNFCLLYML